MNKSQRVVFLLVCFPAMLSIVYPDPRLLFVSYANITLLVGGQFLHIMYKIMKEIFNMSENT